MKLLTNYFVVVLWLLVSCDQVKPPLDKMPPVPNQTSSSPKQQIRYLTRIINEHDPKADYFFQRGKLYFETNKDNQALKDIQQAIRLDSNNAYYYLHLSKIYILQDEPENALLATETANEKGIKDNRIYRSLGKLYYQTKNYKKSALAFDKLKQNISEDAEIAYYEGLLAFVNTDTVKAFDCFKNAIKQDSTYNLPYLELVKLYKKYRAYPVAKHYAQKGLEKSGKNAHLLFEYGTVLEQTRKYDSAITMYAACIKLDAQYWKAEHQLAWIAFQKREYERSKLYLENVLEKYPNHRASNYLIGFIYEYYLKIPERAKQHYEKALEAAPDNLKLKRAIWRVTRKITTNNLPQ